MKKIKSEILFPKTQKFNFNFFKDNNITLITPWGFEDRSIYVLKELEKKDIRVQNIIGIRYLPEDCNNKEEEYRSISRKTAIENNIEVIYDRMNPELIYSYSEKIIGVCIETHSIIVDISGMSKYLIVNLLYILKNLKKLVKVIYCEAEKYYPLFDEFNKMVYDNEGKKKERDNIPSFITTELSKITISRPLLGKNLQGNQIMSFSFFTFNRRDTLALLDYIIPEKAKLVIGIPYREKNYWRKEALEILNNNIEKDCLYNLRDIEKIELGTFDYIGTINSLEKIYELYGSSHVIMVSPNGSKMQAIGVAFFKQMHPDVHVIYPVTKGFKQKYSEGIEEIWELSFDNFYNFNHSLNRHRWRDLDELINILESL